MGYMNSQYRTVEPALIEHRQSYRHQVHIQRAAIREHGRTAKAGELIDLSIYGCRVASRTRFAEGSRLWCQNGHIGCRFDDKLDSRLFRRLTLISE